MDLHGDDSGKLKLLCGMKVMRRFNSFIFVNIHQNVSSLICCY